MAENTNIEWCHHTFNPWRGCTKVSPGCANCYADQLSTRNPTTLGIWGPNGTRIVASQSMWHQPVKWNEEASNSRRQRGMLWQKTRTLPDGRIEAVDSTGFNAWFDAPWWGNMPIQRQRVFCASLGDVFEDWQGFMQYPAKDEHTGELFNQSAWWSPNKGLIKAGQTTENLIHGERPATMQDVRDQLFDLIAATPNLDWLLLTKRPENVINMVPDRWIIEGFPTNVWLGTSVENQAMADKRIPELLKIPAKVRFLSCEPLLGPVNLKSFTPFNVSHGVTVPESCGFWEGIHWVIAGGESGPGARPMHPAWATSLQQQCEAAAVPFLFKQWGNWFPRSQWKFNPHIVLPDSEAHIFEGNEIMHNIGKLKAGRLLHGHEHNGYPKSHLPTS